MGGHSEPRIAQLLSALPPAPDAWVRAAQELPSVRRGLDDLLRRADFRGAVLGDLDRALRDEGVPAHPAVVAALRRGLDAA